jgi:protein-S-isoprenylcysteine O-methyltransferase Ste14
LIFIPALVAVVQLYVIKKEEAYLQQAFGNNYDEYKRKVRRWI